MFSVSAVGGLAGSVAGSEGGGGSPPPVGPVEFDPYWENVVLYTRMDADPPIDLSILAHTLTDGTGLALDTTDFRFGTGSGDLDATSNGNVSATDHADWDLAAGDFTVECWVRFDSDPGATDDSYFVSQWDTTGNERSWALYLQNDTLVWGHSTNGTAETLVTVAWTPTNLQWYNVVATRSAGILRLWVDGEILAAAADAATYNNSTAQLRIGTPVNTGDGNFQRNIDEVRITKGIDRYG